MDPLTDSAAVPAQSTLTRRLLLISGEAEACRRDALRGLQGLAAGRIIWLGAHPPAQLPGMATAKARELLGREFDLLVFDAHDGFDQDAFAAVSGTVRGGGLLVLLAPPLADWPGQTDPACLRFATHPHAPADVDGRFLQRLCCLLDDAGDWLLRGRHTPDLAALLQPIAKPVGFELTAEQAAVVDGLLQVAQGHRRRPLVITADRGRGKSAAMGVAAARTLAAGTARVSVTAPQRGALDALYTHAELELPGATSRIVYRPPDELLRNPQDAELLLVDEAAAIPAPLLEGLLRRYARIAFATTVHGYEGNGRGFALRFRHSLDRLTPQWRELNLRQPVRWAQDDPLEAFVFRALLLDAEAAPAAALQDLDAGDCMPERLNRDALAADEALMAELFGLLVLAHYQTRPADLRQLLDAPDIEVWTLRHRGHVAATALLAWEGGLDQDLAEAVWAGQRRPRGHLVPQTLAAHAGLRQAPALRHARVMRIAVHPLVQGRGLGNRLLAAIGKQARAAGGDLLAVSYGLSLDLLPFWCRAGFTPARLGIRRDGASGSHSLVMLRPLSAAGGQLAREALSRFSDALHHGVADHYRDLAPDLLHGLVRLLAAGPPPDAHDLDELAVFAAGGRDYAGALPALRRLAWFALPQTALWERLTQAQGSALLMRVLQQRDWADVARALGQTGRREVQACLRSAVSLLLSGISISKR